MAPTHDALADLLAAGSDDPFAPVPWSQHPARRRRRSKPVTYRVRLDLMHAKPPIWRRLDLASNLRLDQVHTVIQTAMGWTDSHLHAFWAGASPYRSDSYRCVGGRRACPPEDCGGMPGYGELLAFEADPMAASDWQAEAWLHHFPDKWFDPAAFDVAEVNEALSLK